MKRLLNKIKADFKNLTNDELLEITLKICIYLEGFDIPQKYYHKIYDRLKLIDFELKSSILSLILSNKRLDSATQMAIIFKTNDYKKEILNIKSVG